MSLSKQMLDDLNRDYEPEPRYGDEVEIWPSEAETTFDEEYYE